MTNEPDKAPVDYTPPEHAPIESKWQGASTTLQGLVVMAILALGPQLGLSLTEADGVLLSKDIEALFIAAAMVWSWRGRLKANKPLFLLSR